MESLLVIDDDPRVRRVIQEILASDTLQVWSAENSQQAITAYSDYRPLVVLLDLRLGTESGMEVFDRLRRIDPNANIVFITGHSTTSIAIEAIKLGAFDYLVKPLDLHKLESTVQQALKISRLMRASAAAESMPEACEAHDRLVGSSPAMQLLCKQIGRMAPQDVNVLILGESGTGKELAARAMYQHSLRNQAPFLAINCAAIPEPLLESELFGHEQGAFTGATRQRIGKFEQCDNGTVFLDEVGDMPLSTQAKILRLLQDGQFQRVGGNQTVTVDVRIIAATNHDLEQMIDQGKFRKDLFFRLRGVTMYLPPLRERKEDIAELATYFVRRFNRQLGTHVHSISPDSLALLQAYPWPGNIRELQNMIRESLIASTGPVLLPEFLPAQFQPRAPAAAQLRHSDEAADLQGWRDLGLFVNEALSSGSADIYREALQRFDRLLVTQAMSAAEGLQSRASELLALSRPTLRAKLRALVKENNFRRNLRVAQIHQHPEA